MCSGVLAEVDVMANCVLMSGADMWQMDPSGTNVAVRVPMVPEYVFGPLCEAKAVAAACRARPSVP